MSQRNPSAHTQPSPGEAARGPIHTTCTVHPEPLTPVPAAPQVLETHPRVSQVPHDGWYLSSRRAPPPHATRSAHRHRNPSSGASAPSGTETDHTSAAQTRGPEVTPSNSKVNNRPSKQAQTPALVAQSTDTSELCGKQQFINSSSVQEAEENTCCYKPAERPTSSKLCRSWILPGTGTCHPKPRGHLL